MNLSQGKTHTVIVVMLETVTFLLMDKMCYKERTAGQASEDSL